MIDPRYRHMKANILPEDSKMNGRLEGGGPGRPQGAPARPRGAFGGPPRRKGRGWDALKVLGGTLMDLDGTMGRGNREAAMQGIRSRNEQMRLQQQEAERKAVMAKALKGLGIPGLENLSPEQMSFIYGMKRDGVADARDARNFERGVMESDRGFGFQTERANRSDMESDRGFDRGVVENDRTYAAGRDDAQYRRMHNDRMFDLAETKANAETNAALGPNFDDESKLRKEFFGQNKPFQEVQRAYERIKVTDTSTAAGQMSLIFQYMKLMDPGSTVREGEFATAEQTTGMPGQVVNAYNRALAGEFLNPDQVTDFTAQADNLYNAAATGFERSFQQYRNSASQYSLDPERTIPDLRNPKFQQMPTVTNDVEYDLLPSGAHFLDDEGNTRVKP
ncbi:MAG: hypothetical protein AAFR51_07925 [Pseudomonadota bacterium]